MAVHQAFRFELDPNDQTRARLASHCGASRFAYNWGLGLVYERLSARHAIRQACYEELLSDEETERLARTVEVPWTLASLRKEWNRRKDTVAPWWKENSKEAYSAGLDGLARALDAYSKSKNGERTAETGFPKRKKKWARRSCRFTTGAIRVTDDRHVQLPRIGQIRTKEQTRKLRAVLGAGRGRILSATVSEEAGRFFVSFGCEVERADAPARHLAAVVGVDLGVKHLAVLSTGEFIENPQALSRYERRMNRLRRERSRREKGSKRSRKTRSKLARCQAKVANARRDALHKLTTGLASSYGTVVVEDLNVSGMTAKPKRQPDDKGGFSRGGRRSKAGLNKALLDASPAKLRHQLTYKVAWRGGTIVVADRFFASSKICSGCGAAKAKLALTKRTYRCDECGLEKDRDLNAALNLAAYGRRVLGVAGSGPETRNARGGGHPRHLPKPPMKREDGAGSPGKTVTASPQDEAA